MSARRSTQLRRMLERPGLDFLAEAHSGLSARIAEEAGFAGLWGSGLTISASCGVRDNNELSWTQVLEILEYITDATTIPLLLDGDTGYGNFNNMRRLVRKLEDRGVAGVCIEDKIFPKTNSFIDGDLQPLADTDEFAGKIKAGKDAQRDPDFCIVARVEALIAGWGLGEALKRAEAYVNAGADAILIHSKRSTADEVLAFQREWADHAPVVIVPTKYYSTPSDVFREAGFSVAIWANHLLRASIAAMQQTARSLWEQESAVEVEERIVPVGEVFRLQGSDELQEAERRYLPAPPEGITALVLAASRGRELGSLTEDRPKTLVPIGGRPLLDRIVDTFNSMGIKDITVVRGYRKELIEGGNLRLVDNDEHGTTQEVYSLAMGLEQASGTVVVSYGDVLFHKYIPMSLLESDADICLAVDADWHESANLQRRADYVACDRPYVRHEFDRVASLTGAGADPSELAEINGEWMGLLKLTPAGRDRVLATIRQAPADEQKRMRMTDLLNRLVADGCEVQVLYTRGHWLDVDEMKDVVRGAAFTEGGR